jgi:hypothetical protein
MTPKEKAEELVRKYYTFGINNVPMQSFSWYECKQCALIAVDEIILANPHSNTFLNVEYSTMEYWQEVKEEIEKL